MPISNSLIPDSKMLRNTYRQKTMRILIFSLFFKVFRIKLIQDIFKTPVNKFEISTKLSFFFDNLIVCKKHVSS
jgi:hypothetical protein